MKCSYCGKIIPKKTRYYKGILGGKYHIYCGSKAGIKKKSMGYS